MTIFVSIGPTVAPAEVESRLPEAVLLPPVAAGSLVHLSAERGDIVAIIDGVFRQEGAVRHKEILGLLARGVDVRGASSMGALRAAEMQPFGMKGVGRIFELFASGEIDGDDEVAVMHGSAPEYVALTVALVNLRFGLERAVSDRFVTADQARELIACVQQRPFFERSSDALVRLLVEVGPVSIADDAERALRRCIHDQKREDALRLLDELASAPASDLDIRRRRPVFRTPNYDRLRLLALREDRADPVSDFDLLNAAGVVHDRFPALLRRVAVRTASALESVAEGAETIADEFLLAAFRERRSLQDDIEFEDWLVARRLTSRELLPKLRTDALTGSVDGENGDCVDSEDCERVLRYLRRRDWVSHRGVIPHRWRELLTPQERERPQTAQLVTCFVRGFESLRTRSLLLTELKCSDLFEPALQRARVVTELVRRATFLRPEVDPYDTPVEVLRAWLSSVWDVPESELSWRLLDRGFRSDIGLQYAAAPHHLAHVVSDGRLGLMTDS